MTVVYKRPVSRIAFWSRRLSVFAIGLIVVVGLVHRYQMIETVNFMAVLALAGCLGALAFLFSILGLRALWRDGAVGGGAAFAGLLLSWLAMAPLGFGLWQIIRLPAVSEVSTMAPDEVDWLVPPRQSDVVPIMPAVVAFVQQNGTAALALPLRLSNDDAVPTQTVLSTRRYEGALDRINRAVEFVAERQGFTIVAVEGLLPARQDLEDRTLNEAPGNRDPGAIGLPDVGPIPQPRPYGLAELETVAASPRTVIQAIGWATLFAFPHDVLFLLREDEASTFVDMRVRSRLGGHDLGLEAAMIGRFLTGLDAELLGTAG